MESYRVCCFFTRKFKAIEADMSSFVMEAFEKYTDGGIRMNVDQLRRFLGETVPISYAQRILEEILHRRHHFTSLMNTKTLLYEDFHNYVLSNEVNPLIKSQVHQDMNLPLSHYFIYTSHNSYLTGNQLSSDCSDVPIINALKRGVRVIKLDLWPNSSKDDVQVLHGGTLTVPVELIKCLNSIKEHAFTASPYPVIIILEDHLTPNLQAKVAQMVTDTFREMLFCHKSSKLLKELPTPQSLKYRILISAKLPKRTKSERDKDSTEEPSSSIAHKDKNDQYESDESDRDHDTKDYNVKKSDSCPAYKNLIVIHASNPQGGLVEALEVENDEVKLLSLSERHFEQAAEHHQQKIVRFTQNNILRTYPAGTRFLTLNYNPHAGWLHGAQMIAFNMQEYARSLWLMHGKFRANGGCGYVKKPDFLMTTGPNNEVFDPKAKLPVKTILKVKIYTGDGWHLDFKRTHFSAFSPPDFYTKVGISGAPADYLMKRTMVKEDTWTPVWDQEFKFPLTLPEMALLRIEVHTYDMFATDDFAGQTCLPVSELIPGMHVVPLFNRKGDPYTGARLLMQFQFVSNES